MSVEKPDTKYVKEYPLWDINPSQLIVPLLHLEIGMVNKAWNDFKLYLDMEIEQVSVEEQDSRREVLLLSEKIYELQDDTDVLFAEKQMIYSEMKHSRAELKLTKKNWQQNPSTNNQN